MKDKDEYYSKRGCEHKLITILLIFMISLTLLFSCEKLEDKYCWTCIMYFYERAYFTNGDIWERRYTDSIQKCGFTERDIQKFERYRTVGKHHISTCGDRICWQECYCVKLEEE